MEEQKFSYSWIIDPNQACDFDLSETKEALDKQISLMVAQPEKFDIAVAIASGFLSGVIDVISALNFDFREGRKISDEKLQDLVKKAANLLGDNGEINALERKFKIPSDGNTPDFGGGLQHHLRDFAHHPTTFGLFCSILTQFTGKCFGTDTNGALKIVSVPASHKYLIGGNVVAKLVNGIVVWFFHLISDVAGSSSSFGKGGGTGIPGPVLALAKELSALPVFRNTDVSEILSKLFNGTFLARRNENGEIIRDSVMRFDLRAEMGVCIELAKQSLPVVINECVVRTLFFISRFYNEFKRCSIASLEDFSKVDWESTIPVNKPELTRMLTISTGVFEMVDIADAVIERNVLALNFVGIGRFTVALGAEAVNMLKIKNVKQIRRAYQSFEDNMYNKSDAIFERCTLTREQLEILFNLECLKVENDIELTTKNIIVNKHIPVLKRKWLSEWKEYIENAFPSYTGDSEAKIKWYSPSELMIKIAMTNPLDDWFVLVLMEAIVFVPYYPMKEVTDKSGKCIPDKTYKALKIDINRFSKCEGDDYLDSLLVGQNYYRIGVVRLIRDTYEKTKRELGKPSLTSLKRSLNNAETHIMNAFVLSVGLGVLSIDPLLGLCGIFLVPQLTKSSTIAVVGGGATIYYGVSSLVNGTSNEYRIYSKDVAITNTAKLLTSAMLFYRQDDKYMKETIALLNANYDIVTEALNGVLEVQVNKRELFEKRKRLELEKLIIENARRMLGETSET